MIFKKLEESVAARRGILTPVGSVCPRLAYEDREN